MTSEMTVSSKPNGAASPGYPSPASPSTRSRTSSNASQKYVPPKGKYSEPTANSSGSVGSSSDQARFKQWLTWDTTELEKRQRALIGKTVVGKLSPKRGNRYFIKWNINANDTIVISSDKVEEVLGDAPPAGMWVSCTIVGLGPGHVQWNKQHPYAMTLESRETRQSHQPSKGTMPRGSPHWKKAQKAGLVRPVTDELDHRATVPAEINMARYQAPRRQSSLGSGGRSPAAVRQPRTSVTTIPAAAPKGILPQTVPQPDSAIGLKRATVPTGSTRFPSLGSVGSSPTSSFECYGRNGANINLVTGEIRQRGRADTGGSWRRRDRSFTV